LCVGELAPTGLEDLKVSVTELGKFPTALDVDDGHSVAAVLGFTEGRPSLRERLFVLASMAIQNRIDTWVSLPTHVRLLM
jgi:hypothetical protein